MLDKGAIVIDVRTSEEFEGGSVKDAKNNPLQIIQKQAKRNQAI